MTASISPIPRRLEGRRALVTAAARGIGRATAERLAAEGASVVAFDIDADALAELAGAHISTVCADLALADALGHGIDDRRFDILVNAVGWVHQGTLLDCSVSDWRRSFELNVDSAFHAIRFVLPAMLERRRGSIINISSVAGQRGASVRAAYSATKAALVGLTKSVSADYAARGIRCNAICPAMVDTPSLRARIAAAPDPAAARATFVSRHPVGRLGEAEEVAALAAYLASDESAFMTGSALMLDGGAAA